MNDRWEIVEHRIREDGSEYTVRIGGFTSEDEAWEAMWDNAKDDDYTRMIHQYEILSLA